MEQLASWTIEFPTGSSRLSRAIKPTPRTAASRIGPPRREAIMHRSLYPLCLAGLLAILAFVSCSRDASVPISPVIRGTDAGPARGIGVSQEPLAIADDSLPPGSVGADYTAFLTSSGGEGIPHLFKLDGDLPRGLRMDRFFGAMSTVIHGVPTEAGSSVFTVQVKDQAKNTATKTLTITIGPPTPVEITNLSPDLKKGTVGQPYSANL